MARLIEGNAMLTIVVSTTAMNDATHNSASAMRGLSSPRIGAVSSSATSLVLSAVAAVHTCQAGAEASCISRSTMSSSTSAKNVPTTSSISLNPSAQKSSGW
jgi:hypothetical protein